MTTLVLFFVDVALFKFTWLVRACLFLRNSLSFFWLQICLCCRLFAHLYLYISFFLNFFSTFRKTLHLFVPNIIPHLIFQKEMRLTPSLYVNNLCFEITLISLKTLFVLSFMCIALLLDFCNLCRQHYNS